MNKCSICLNNVRKTRSTRELPCGHIFHGSCIARWKEQGKNTCPICRKLFDVSTFKVSVKIENRFNNSSQTVNVNPEEAIELINDVQLLFEPDVSDDLESILIDLGVSLSDINSLVLDTE